MEEPKSWRSGSGSLSSKVKTVEPGAVTDKSRSPKNTEVPETEPNKVAACASTELGVTLTLGTTNAEFGAKPLMLAAVPDVALAFASKPKPSSPSVVNAVPGSVSEAKTEIV